MHLELQCLPCCPPLTYNVGARGKRWTLDTHGHWRSTVAGVDRGPRAVAVGGRAADSLHTAEASRSVSRLSAVIPHAASRRTTAPCPAASGSRADAVLSMAAEGPREGVRMAWHARAGVQIPSALLSISAGQTVLSSSITGASRPPGLPIRSLHCAVPTPVTSPAVSPCTCTA
jgi:hypothetical protein